MLPTAPHMPPFHSEQSDWFSQHLHPHESMLRSWLLNRFPSLTDVDDIIHDSYLKVLAVHEKGEVVMEAPKAFLFATARNRALDLLRRQKKINHEPIVENDPSFVMQAVENAAKAKNREHDLELMTEAIQSLPDRCRQVFTLRKVYGYSHEEIAKKLGISTNTVAVQVSLGLRKCKAYMRKHR